MPKFSFHVTNTYGDQTALDFDSKARLDEIMTTQGDDVKEFHSFSINGDEVLICGRYERTEFLATVDGIVTALEKTY